MNMTGPIFLQRDAHETNDLGYAGLCKSKLIGWYFNKSSELGMFHRFDQNLTEPLSTCVITK